MLKMKSLILLLTIVFSTQLCLTSIAQEQTNLIKPTERLVLKDITPQFLGPASRVLVMESPDEHYTYLVKGAGVTGRGFNCTIEEKGPREIGSTLNKSVNYLKTCFGVNDGVLDFMEGGLRIEFDNYEYKAEFSGRFVKRGEEPTITFGGGNLGVYVKRLEDVERYLIILGDSVLYIKGLNTWVLSALVTMGEGEVPVLEKIEALSKLWCVKPAIWTEGSEHTILGKVEFWGYQAIGDNEYPLVFKMIKDTGYAYLCGRGTVTTKDGKTYRLGYEDTVDTLLPLLKSDDQFDREGAAQALGWLTKTKEDKEKALPALIKALADEEAMEVRRNAAEALGRISDLRSLDVLIQGLKENESDLVREVAAEALVNIGEPAVEPLIAALKDKYIAEVVWALGELKDDRAIEPLMFALLDIGVREEAIEALQKITNHRPGEWNDWFKRNGAELLGRISDLRSLDTLIQVSKEDESDLVREVAAEALRKITNQWNITKNQLSDWLKWWREQNQIYKDLTVGQMIVYMILREGNYTASELAMRGDISESEINEFLKELEKKGLIEKKGENLWGNK